jgi:hypothetical protein
LNKEKYSEKTDVLYAILEIEIGLLKLDIDTNLEVELNTNNIRTWLNNIKDIYKEKSI